MFYESLFEIQPGVETRWASGENPKGAKGAGGTARRGRKGAAWQAIENGQSVILAEVTGRSGMVRRIWSTLENPDKKKLRGVFIEMYWDGSNRPAVRAPIGDFFCHGIGRMATFENALFSSPEGRNFNCCIPMPFKTGMKILVRNESGEKIKHFYYDVDYTLGDLFKENTRYFHSWFNREAPTQMGQDFELLPQLRGSGRFLGVNLGIRCNQERYFKTWWGEGEVKVYLDGDTEYPTLCGTGVEDYVATAWGQDYYHNLYHGSQIYDTDTMEIGCYRLHIPDPVFFHQDIRVTVQQIGGIDTDDERHKAQFHFNELSNGFRYRSVNGCDIDFPAVDPSVVLPELFEREDEWSCCSYFYYDEPENSLPQLAVKQCLID